MMSLGYRRIAKKMIREYFGKRAYVYVSPRTDNAYGDGRNQRVTRTDVLSFVENVVVDGGERIDDRGNYERMTIEEITKMVLNDMQYDHPQQ